MHTRFSGLWKIPDWIPLANVDAIIDVVRSNLRSVD
jgi:hypothetical protein